MKKVLAIDQASKDIGICRVRSYRGGQPIYDVEAMHFKETGASCLARWERWIVDELHGEHDTYPYDLVICEDYARIFASGIINHKILGLIELACFKRGLRLIKVPPSSLKLFATGNGDASKEQMVLMAEDAIENHTGERPTLTDDAADAYWLGVLGYHIATEMRTGDPCTQAIVNELSRTEGQVKADKRQTRLAQAQAVIAAAEAKEARKVASGQREQARQDSKATREAAQEARRVARELRAAETLRKRTEAAQKRAEKAGKK